MSEKTPPPAPGTPGGGTTLPRRPGHRGQDVRDTVAELAAKAHEISLEAGSKMAAAMKDIIGAAAGLSNFAMESARDLTNYMVRRGQMTADEAEKLLRDVEEGYMKKHKGARPADKRPEKPKPAPIIIMKAAPGRPPAQPAAPAKPAPAAAPAKAAAKAPAKPAAKPAAKAPAKPAAKKPAPKPAAKKPAPKPAAKKPAPKK